MQPAYPQPLAVNNFSQSMRAKRDEWAESLGIKPSEMLIFRKIGNGSNNILELKSSQRSAEFAPFEAVKTTNQSWCPPNHESIADAAAPGGYVQAVYYEGGYFPGKTKAMVKFAGSGDETVLAVVPEEKPDLYDFLTLSPRLQGGINQGRTAAQFELLRPDAAVEANWQDDQKQAEVIVRIGTATVDTLRFLAPKLHLPSDTPTEQRLRKNFADFAKLNMGNVAKLAALFNADETRIYQQVEKAIAADIVAVNKEKAVWVLTSTQEPITAASPDRNTLDQLVGHLILEPGQTTYKQILALTSKRKQ